jgi:hypothetical protein
MRIAIVGGGWVGCHLALKLKEHHDVCIFEKNNSLFKETSYNNQNRLHLGYHYSRNYKTRELCKDTFNRFLQDYEHLTEIVENNYYCVTNKSTIDFKTFQYIFDSFDCVQTNLDNIEGCIATEERYINFQKAFDFFNTELSNICLFDVKVESLQKLKLEYDLVINATNNFLNSVDFGFFEKTITLIYKKLTKVNFGAITLVDGRFFSIYPYDNKDKYTLSDVEHTPIKIFRSVDDLNSYKINSDIVSEKRFYMEKKVVEYYPNFLSDFCFDGFFISTKSKFFSESADRYPKITIDGNLVNCFTGKIQGIYVIEDFIKGII